jgi:AcrR family transcriptional regulator
LSAARACFARLGYERATNKDIAAAVGITAAALYRYFDGKPALYAAVVQDAVAERVSRLRTSFSDVSAGSARESFGALLRAGAEMDDEQLATTQFLLEVPTEMNRHPELAKEIRANPNEMFAVVSEIVQSGVDANEITPDNAPLVVSLIMATLFGVSAYSNAVGRDAGKRAIAGFIALLENRLFR